VAEHGESSIAFQLAIIPTYHDPQLSPYRPGYTRGEFA
jgi:hypothetical protein